MKFLDKKFTIILIILFIIICIAIYFFTKDEAFEFISTDELYVSSVTNETVQDTQQIIIHIDGEVANPGLVYLPTEARIADAITKAGGTTELANLSKINLAYEVKDGQKIYIPSIYDEEEIVYIQNSAGENIIAEDLSNDSKLININTATQSELETLPRNWKFYSY